MRSESEVAGTPRRSFTGAARREQLTQAAIEVLADRGFAAASLSAIAERVGVSKGVLSYHFSDKSDLVREVVQTVLERAGAWMTPRIEGATSYRDALHRYISANVSFLEAHQVDIIALSEVLANSRIATGVPDTFERSQHDAIVALEKLFADGQRAGEFGDLPAGILAMSLRATIDAATQRMRSDAAFDFERFEHELIALYDRGTAR